MLNAVGGVLRRIAQVRSKRADRHSNGAVQPATARRLHRRAIGLARFLADALTPTPRARQRATAVIAAARRDRARQRASARRRLYRRHLVLRFTSDRTLPIAIALIVLVAAGLSFAPAATPVGAAQGAQSLQGIRLTVGGGPAGPAEFDGDMPVDELSAAGAGIDDGTVYKPVAVNTTVQSSADKLRHYTVRSGDSLTGIASRFGVSMMTVWWANKLTTKDSLKVGMDLMIPPVNGLVVTVAAGDTLDSLAASYTVSIEDIIAINELADPNLIVGQVLVLPGAKGAPIPTPTPKPTRRPSSGGSGGGFVYVSGPWAWPVPGGYISQYFHYGHYGVDIAAPYGSRIISPRDGTVVFAGWKSNGGGYQVWVYHGNGLYSAHHHMSAVTVSTGQTVAKGQQIGRIGQTGWATGPHDHFEVWVGFPWKSGSYRVNALRYY